MARLKDKYKNEIAGALAKEFDIKNPMGVPKVTKVIVNMGLGEASSNAKILTVVNPAAAYSSATVAESR